MACHNSFLIHGTLHSLNLNRFLQCNVQGGLNFRIDDGNSTYWGIQHVDLSLLAQWSKSIEQLFRFQVKET